MGLKEFQSAGETGGNTFAITWSAQIPRGSDDTGDDTVMIAHREFRRQTPTGPAMRVPMQFQMIDDRAASADNGLVLIGVKFGQFFRKNFLHVPAKEFLFIAATTTFDEGLIDGDITAASVLDEKYSVGNVIEELFDDG